MVLSEKQKMLLLTVWLGHERSQLLTLDEVLELLPYKTSKQSLQFSIRCLIKRHLMEKGDCQQSEPTIGQYKRLLGLTALGRATVKRLLTRG